MAHLVEPLAVRDSLVALPPGRDAGCDALLQQHGAILSLSYPLSAINAVPSVPRKVPPIKHGAAPPFTPGRRAIRFDPGGIHQQHLLLCRCAIDQASSENSKVQTPYRPTAETVAEGFVGSMHGRGIHASAAHRGARGRCRQQLLRSSTRLTPRDWGKKGLLGALCAEGDRSTLYDSWA